MATTFDPYQAWLGITDARRPVDHYRLLGVSKFEADGAAIGSAAASKIARLKPHLSGPHSTAAQKILDQILAAQQCLLNDQSRAAYEQALAAREGVATPRPAAIPSGTALRRAPANSKAPTRLAQAGKTSSATRKKKPKSSPARQAAGAIVGGGVGLFIGYVILCFIRGPQGNFLHLPLPAWIVGESRVVAKTDDREQAKPTVTPIPVTSKPRVEKPPRAPKPVAPSIPDIPPAPVPVHLSDDDLKGRARRGVGVLKTDISGSQRAGYATLIERQGLVLTNYHLIAGVQAARIELTDGSSLDVEGVVDFDAACDLVVLRVTPARDETPAAELAESSLARREVRACSLVDGDINVRAIPLGAPWASASAFHPEVMLPARDGGGWPLEAASWPNQLAQSESGTPLFDDAGRLIAIATCLGPGELTGAISVASLAREIPSLGDRRPVPLAEFLAMCPPPSPGQFHLGGGRSYRQKAPDVSAEGLKTLFPELPAAEGVESHTYITREYDDGRMRAFVEQAQGRLAGPTAIFYPDEQIQILGAYSEQDREGRFFYWDTKGRLLFDGEFSKDRLHGVATLFKDGRPWLIQEYRRGVAEAKHLVSYQPWPATVESFSGERDEAQMPPGGVEALARMAEIAQAMEKEEKEVQAGLLRDYRKWKEGVLRGDAAAASKEKTDRMLERIGQRSRKQLEDVNSQFRRGTQGNQ